VFGLAVNLMADVKLPAIFSDNMVIQAGKPIQVWGTATPDEAITVQLGDDTASSKAGPDGRWKVALPARDAGVDLKLTVSGKNKIEISNVAIGEVWVCSGQSNMAMTLSGTDQAEQDASRARYPLIRMLTVARTNNIDPQSDFSGKWEVCSPKTAPNFSAVAFFFGRDLHEELNVPVGLINSSWGGTRIEPWTEFESLKLIPGFEKQIENTDKLRKGAPELWKEYREGMANKEKAFKDVCSLETNEALGLQMADPALDTSKWLEMDIPVQWEKAGLPAFDGLVWFRKEIDVPTNWAGKDLVLHLGPVDEMDATWFNQVRIGGEGSCKDGIVKFWEIARNYKVPGSAVKAGRNTLAVRVIDTGWAGGIWGEAASKMYLECAGKTDRVAVAGKWRYQVGPRLFGNVNPPVNHGTPTALYNAMIHPMVQYGIRGAIWYQGEANLSEGSVYTDKMRALIDSWRRVWGQGEFPFLFVQLAPYHYGNTNTLLLPEIWNAQREALAIPNTGMATITDLGNLRDIHPRRKREVGARLALWALARTYGHTGLVYSGPLARRATKDGLKVRIEFDSAGGGLVGREGASLSWFDVAGTNGTFARAAATIEKNTVVVSGGAGDPVEVRYGWAEDAEPELTNLEGLPASPFRMKVE